MLHPDANTTLTRRQSVINLVGGGVKAMVYDLDDSRGIILMDHNDLDCKWIADPNLVIPASKNSLAVVNGIEYFYCEDRNIYRAPIANPLDVNGYRMGARFECPCHMGTQLFRILGIMKDYSKE